MNDWKWSCLRWSAIWLLPFAAVGCVAEGGETEGAEDVGRHEQAALPAECTALGETINTHTCWHGVLGPYVNIGSSAPDVLGGIHEWFYITLSGSGPYTRTLALTPSPNDDYAIYFDPNVTVTVKDKTGSPVSPGLSGTITSCDDLTGTTGQDLTGYAVFDLKGADAPYAVTFQASVPTISVVLERVSPMAVAWFVDNDNDGYGPIWPFLLTACEPWSPYVTPETGDCDDNDPDVYPGQGCP